MTVSLLKRERHRENEKTLTESDKLAFTIVAGGISGAVAILALLIAVLDGLGAAYVSENIEIALIGLAAAGLIGLAVASAGHVIARAYPAGHITGVVALSGSLDVEVNGKVGKAFAAWVSPDGKVEYLVGYLGGELEWEPGSTVSLKD